MNKSNLFFFILSVFLSHFSFSQSNYPFNYFILNNTSENDYIFERNNKSKKKLYKFSFNSFVILNNGHSNLDNNAELFSKGRFTDFVSARFEYYNSWLSLTLEPYSSRHKNIFQPYNDLGMYAFSNNQNNVAHLNKNDHGLRQSSLLIHYKGVGVKYGLLSHWWGPGKHSALAISSNAPSQKSFSLGTFKDIQLNKLSIGFKVLAIPFKNYMQQQIYFSGLKANISYNSSNSTTTIGFHRTYLSGDFFRSDFDSGVSRKWTIFDAASLVFEPLFGQSKKGLEYALPGTPGFDVWDQLLSGFILLKFHEENLEIYLDLASDDNRANFIDLRAHWDHTLGYQLGINKVFKYKRYEILTGAEFLTTRISNTLNPKFNRGDPNSPNFYTKKVYDYFSYKGRRMGAHSGSSSDDLIFLFGLKNKESAIMISYNKERHGIKSMLYPELKSEYSISYQRNFFKNHKLYLNAEYEKIDNYAFIENNVSVSNLFLIGYSLYFN